MSPFVSSLLALAALLATAHGYCTTKSIGRHTPYPVDYEPVDFYPPGATIDLNGQNYCLPGMRVVGEDITVCNKNPRGVPPAINGPEEGSWSPFDVLCSQRECPRGGDVKIRQYCDYWINNSNVMRN